MATETCGEPKLLHIFIFNATLGQKEGHEHEKILYYHPSSADLDTQVRHVGLAEAITRFSSTFDKCGSCESVHTQKTRQVFYQPEPDVWIVMTVSVGWIWRSRNGSTGIGVREYLGEHIQDVVLKAHLNTIYKCFSLIHNSISNLLDTKGIHGLKATLSSFMNSYIDVVEVCGGDIMTVWTGVSFLPLDRQTFLRIHCCLSLLQTSIPSIQHTAFFYGHQVVWCGFGMDDLQALSHYLKTYILPSNISSSSHSSSSSSTASSYLTRFIGEGVTPSRKVYIHSEEDGNKLWGHYLLIYNVAGVTVTITLKESESLTPVLFEKIDRLLDDKIAQLASDINEQINNKKTGSDGGLMGGSLAVKNSASGSNNNNFRYVYHNDMNLATKSTIHNNGGSGGGGGQSIPPDVIKSITDLHTDMKKCDCGEGVVKTCEDHWIVGRRGDGREFYVIVSHKNANLVQVTDEVNRMCASHFSNIFIIE